MRDETPVYQSPDGTFVALSRYDDVIAAALDWETYSSAQFGENPPLEILNLFDPPVHVDLKARLSAAYSPQRILALEPEIRSIAQSLIEEMKANDSGDLIHQFIRPLTTSVMGLLLGMTDEQIALCQRLTDATLLTGPEIVGKSVGKNSIRLPKIRLSLVDRASLDLATLGLKVPCSTR